MEVIGNKVTILVDACERDSEIDEARAQAAIERARERLARYESDKELGLALQAFQRAQVRLNVSRRRRTRPGTPPVGSDSG